MATVALIIANVFVPVKYLSSYFVARSRADANLLRVTFVDVGFGDCAIIELPDGKNMLIDGGDGGYAHNLKVLSALNGRDVETIDYLVCSSVNAEHCGGLSEVVKYKKVKTIYMPFCNNRYVTDAFKRFYDETAKCGAQIVYSEYNEGVKAEKYFFTFLSPSVKEFADGEYAQLNVKPSKSARNNSSAVLWLEYGDTAILFASDVETKILNSITDAYGLIGDDYPVKLERCKIVQLVGHGSSFSECAAFYDALSPETAVISVGENGNGCPSVQAMSDVVNSVGTELYRTDERGNIVIEITATGYAVK